MTREKAETIALVVVGTFLGFLLALVTAFWIPTSPVSLGAAATTLCLGPYCHLYGRALRSPALAALPAMAWLVTALVLGSARAEGDVVVTGDVNGLAFLLLGTVSAAVGIGTVRRGIDRSDLRASQRADVSPNGSSDAPNGR